MAAIVFVHGMRMQHHSKPVLHAKWYRALLAGLKAMTAGRADEMPLPRMQDIELVYWADLFGRGRPVETVVTKGGLGDELRSWYYGFLRAAVRAADRRSIWGEDGRPHSVVARLVEALVTQSAIYMKNAAVAKPDPGIDPGAFFQVQQRFRHVLRPDTRVVIGHSLGSVIAYEGLCLWKHHVDTFVTVGSPIATPRLILQPMRERLARLLALPTAQALPWPSVKEWRNVFASADVWSVPVTRLAPIFDARIVDVEVMHGMPTRPVETHKLTSYLRHVELLEAIAGGLGAGARPALEMTTSLEALG
jgi:pimeloyl-ACP methyl ester carboxylesterase